MPHKHFILVPLCLLHIFFKLIHNPNRLFEMRIPRGNPAKPGQLPRRYDCIPDLAPVEILLSQHLELVPEPRNVNSLAVIELDNVWSLRCLERSRKKWFQMLRRPFSSRGG